MGNFDFQAIKQLQLDKIILYFLWAVTIVVLSIIFYQARRQQKYNNHIFTVLGKNLIPFDLKRTNDLARCTASGILDILEWNVKGVDSWGRWTIISKWRDNVLVVFLYNTHFFSFAGTEVAIADVWCDVFINEII